MTETVDAFAAALAHHKAGRVSEAVGFYRRALDGNPAHADALFNLGALMSAEGRHEEAVAYYERVLELLPGNAEALSNLGNVMMAKGRRAEAEVFYRRAMASDPALAPPHANLGHACFQAERYEEAIRHYERAIELDAGLAPAHSNLAVILSSLGKTKEARAHLEEAVSADPDDAEARNNVGNLLSNLGEHEAAAEHLRHAIRLKPAWAQAHFNYAIALSKANQSDLALDSYREALRLEPEYAEALRNGGALLLQRGEGDEARRWLESGLAIRPDDAETLFYLGNLFHQRRDAEKAVELFKRAIDLDDATPEIHNNLGNSLRDLGRYDEAIEAALRALTLKPDFAHASNTLGNALMAKRAFEEAAEAYRRALELDSGFAVAATNLGNAYRAMGRMDEALRWFEEALDIDPDLADTHNSIGLMHQASGRHREAMIALGRAIELKPNYAEALNNLAISLQEAGRHGEAIQRYRDALAADGEVAEIYYNLGSLLQTLGRYDESVVVFSQALRVRPDYGAVFSFLAHSLMQQCSWQNLDAVIAKTVAQIEHEIETGQTVSASAFALQSMPVPLELRLRAAREIAKRYAARVAPVNAKTQLPHARRENGKLRIGYVSPDFRFHSVAVAFKGLLEHHDRARFHLFGYSLATGTGGPTGNDGLTEFFRQRFDSFAELAGMPFEDAVQRIADDGIDILVDLAGHTRGARLELFAAEPAPVQAHYLGYSTTIGADYIPYLITDRTFVPPEFESSFHEKLVFLPDTFMATTRASVADEQPTRAELGLPEAAFVFANFNSHYKFDPQIFAIWMRLLRKLPDSVMWFTGGTPTSRKNLRREAETRGVAHTRLIFADKVVHGLHLARHSHVDLALDNRYHGGGVTTVDALWMGVPVLTLAGDAPQSRNGASLLGAIDLSELVTYSLDEYERFALDLSQSPERLTALKQKLAGHRLSSPLFDTERLTRHLEIAYGMMWDNFAAGKPPQTMHVPALPKTH